MNSKTEMITKSEHDINIIDGWFVDRNEIYAKCHTFIEAQIRDRQKHILPHCSSMGPTRGYSGL